MEPASVEKIVEIDSHIGESKSFTKANGLSGDLYVWYKILYHTYKFNVFAVGQKVAQLRLIPTSICGQRNLRIILCMHRQCVTYLSCSLNLNYISLGCAVSGLIADSRTMVDKARVEAQVQRRSLVKLFYCLVFGCQIIKH